MINGPVVAIMFHFVGGYFADTNEYVAAYKDLDTCIKRIEVLAKENPSLRRYRYCKLEGIITDFNVGKN